MTTPGTAADTGLIETYRGAVYPWHCDHMGHMNVMWYVGKFDEATWQLFSMLGLGPGWLRDNQRGMAALDQRIAYQRELHPGDTVVVRSGVLEVGGKTVRFAHRMFDAATGELAAVTQLVAAHLDTQARRAVPLPEAVAARAREMQVAMALPWER
jgi:acyl-CoA thioester hydrolase